MSKIENALNKIEAEFNKGRNDVIVAFADPEEGENTVTMTFFNAADAELDEDGVVKAAIGCPPSMPDMVVREVAARVKSLTGCDVEYKMNLV